MAGVLVVCTGNVCRSPIAEGMLRALFGERFGRAAPETRSAGTMGWVGSRAEPNAVEAAAEHGIDLSAHRARALDDDETRSADLVLVMAAEHADVVARLVAGTRARTFALKELVELLERLPPPNPGEPTDVLRERVVAAADVREREGVGLRDVDVADPLGSPLETFRAVAWELNEWSRRLVDGLFGPATDRAATAREVRDP